MSDTDEDAELRRQVCELYHRPEHEAQVLGLHTMNLFNVPYWTEAAFVEARDALAATTVFKEELRQFYTAEYCLEDAAYCGTFLHHLARLPVLCELPSVPLAVAWARLCGADYYAQLDSNGDAACFLMARARPPDDALHSEVARLLGEQPHSIASDPDFAQKISL